MTFSPKQRKVLTWWRPGSPDQDRQAIICDGAVRSGKTLCTGLSFFCWAMRSFHNRNFALCGRTIQSVRRNMLSELIPLLEGMGFRCVEKVSKNVIQVRLGGRRNTFYLFGGKDESSAALIQGITLAGALLEGGPEGLNVQEFSCGETGWDESGRLLRRGVQAVCGCWVCAWGETDGVFLDFELRGGLQA